MTGREVTGPLPRAQQFRNAWRSMTPRGNRSGEVWAISLVRNEADIIAETVGALLRQNVDRILVADNMSTDDTADILRSLDDGSRLTVISDREVKYFQSEKMSHLAHLATRAGAEWVIPFDADEIWMTTSGVPIGDFLRSSAASIVTATSYEYFPAHPTDGASPVERFQYRMQNPEAQGKVAFRSNVLAQIRIGNHSVNRPGAHGSGLEIAHFRYRSFEHIAEKVRHGARAVEAAELGPGLIRRWRELATLDDDQLQEFVTDLENMPDLVHDPVRPKLARMGSQRES
jgi:hypothetical protein